MALSDDTIHAWLEDPGPPAAEDPTTLPLGHLILEEAKVRAMHPSHDPCLTPPHAPFTARMGVEVTDQLGRSSRHVLDPDECRVRCTYVTAKYDPRTLSIRITHIGGPAT